MSTRQTSPKKADTFSCLMLALVGALWGWHGPAVKFAYAAGFNLPQLVLGETIIAVLVFGAVVLWQGSDWPTSRRIWIALLLSGTCGGSVPFFLFWAYRLGPISIGATLFFLYVPFTQLLNLAVTRRWPQPTDPASTALVVIGAALSTDFLSAANAANLRGAPFAVMAAFCFASFFVLAAPLGQTATPALRAFICCAIPCSMLTIISTVLGWPFVPPTLPLTHTFLWAVTLGLVWQVTPVFLMMRFLPRTGSGLGSILTSTELPVAVVSSSLLFGEHLRASQHLGIALVLAGTILPHFPSRRFLRN